MGEVVHVNFGAERDWEHTRSKLHEGLRSVGGMFGDDEQLMNAKAECVYHVLREIVEDVPTVQVTAKMPADLTSAQVEEITEMVREAVLKGIEAAMAHSVQAMMGSIYDMCTSKLSR